MKNLMIVILTVLACETGMNALTSANDFQSRNGNIKESFNDVTTAIGTAKNANLDGVMGLENMAGRVLSGDKKAIAAVQKTCLNPDVKIKSTCSLMTDYLS
jgi:hypothetical protein